MKQHSVISWATSFWNPRRLRARQSKHRFPWSGWQSKPANEKTSILRAPRYRYNGRNYGATWRRKRKHWKVRRAKDKNIRTFQKILWSEISSDWDHNHGDAEKKELLKNTRSDTRLTSIVNHKQQQVRTQWLHRTDVKEVEKMFPPFCLLFRLDCNQKVRGPTYELIRGHTGSISHRETLWISDHCSTCWYQ